MSVKTVLIVDDSQTSRKIIHSLMKDLYPDWQIHEAESGEESIDMLAILTPDLVTMDMNMSGLDGLEAAKMIKEKLPETTVVLFTGNIQNVVRDRAAALGIGFVAKPVTLESVQQVIDHLG